MKAINLSITNQEGTLRVTAADDKMIIGAQYDHNAQTLVFARPDEYRDHDLILLFSDGVKSYRKNLGGGNEYVIPNALTQQKTLCMQIALQHGADYLAGTNMIKFQFRSSISGGTTPTPIVDKGYNGWTPLFALVADGERRVYQIVDWTGGDGSKPETGLFVGSDGLVSDIADAADVRGETGLQGEPEALSNMDIENILQEFTW